MRRMCEESKDMGLKCMGMLENQGESIEKWEEVADGINEDMKLAEKALRDMDRACFGMIPKFWKIGGGFKEDDAIWREPEQPKNVSLPNAKTLNPDHRFVATSEESGEMNDKEKEMEENMDEVGKAGTIQLIICDLQPLRRSISRAKIHTEDLISRDWIFWVLSNCLTLTYYFIHLSILFYYYKYFSDLQSGFLLWRSLSFSH